MSNEDLDAYEESNPLLQYCADRDLEITSTQSGDQYHVCLMDVRGNEACGSHINYMEALRIAKNRYLEESRYL